MSRRTERVKRRNHRLTAAIIISAVLVVAATATAAPTNRQRVKHLTTSTSTTTRLQVLPGGNEVELIPPTTVTAPPTTLPPTTTTVALPPPTVVTQAAQRTGVDWDCIALWETSSNWSMQGSTYSGGLGFYNGTWDSFGGREFASNAGLATKEQQIIVAERVYAKYGMSGWGSRHHCGY